MPAPARAADPLAAFDLLATMVALVQPDGLCLHANASFENTLGVARRALLATSLPDWLAEPAPLRETLAAVAANRIASGRFDGQMRRPAGGHTELLPVHVIVNQTEDAGQVLVEMIEIEQQTRQDREERAQGQAEANKELVRNLAHEIKNPLGGIRGAAQLLEMELEGKRELTEYTQVIIAEADRLQALVDRLLAPHRRAAGRGRRQHPRGLRAGALAGAGRIPARPDRQARLRHLDPRVSRRPRAADPGRAQHRPQRRAGAGPSASPPATPC